MSYMSGFASYHETEAIPGALPQGQNNPKKHSLGLYTEQLNSTAFTMPRTENFRSWLYKIRPSVGPHEFESLHFPAWASQKTNKPISPKQRRWTAVGAPKANAHFVQGSAIMVRNSRIAVGVSAFNEPMGNTFFYNADAEMVLMPEKGSLSIPTEMGLLEADPGEIITIPRGVKFQVNPKDLGEEFCRLYFAENFGHIFVLPDLGPIGANGLANQRDFLAPKAKYHDEQGDYKIIAKFDHNFWQLNVDHHPLDVVAWHGNTFPYKYDLKKFNTMGSISYDHPDPSIFTVLTSPSNEKGKASIDLAIFPPRWMVAENTFKPPYYHRNCMSEYMGLLYGAYDAKETGFLPGSSSLHNCMSAHGPEAEVFEKASSADEKPYKLSNTMAFMFESCDIFQPSEFALTTGLEDKSYLKCWNGFKKYFKGEQ